MTTERYGDPRFYALLDEIAELHSRKNHDYSRQGEPLSNFKRSEAFGVEPWRGIMVRMSDKWSRIEELSKGKTAKNESLRDSLIDNAVYSLLAVLLLNERKPLPDCPFCGEAVEHGTDCLGELEAVPEVGPIVPDLGMAGWQAGAQAAVDSYRAIEQTEGGFGFVLEDHAKMGPR